MLGGILMAVGILIAGASGLCSLVFLFSAAGGDPISSGILPLILIIGGAPFAGGVGLAFGGWTVIRRARKAKEGDGDVSEIFE
jgi:hypothetical protein